MDGLWWSRIYRWNVCLHAYSTTTAFRAFCANAFMLKNQRQKICELEWERLSMSSIYLRTVISQLMVERTWLPLSKRIELLVIAMPSIPLSVIWERVNGRRMKSNMDWRGKKRNASQGILTKWRQSTRKFEARGERSSKDGLMRWEMWISILTKTSQCPKQLVQRDGNAWQSRCDNLFGMDISFIGMFCPTQRLEVNFPIWSPLFILLKKRFGLAGLSSYLNMH